MAMRNFRLVEMDLKNVVHVHLDVMDRHNVVNLIQHKINYKISQSNKLRLITYHKEQHMMVLELL